MNKMYIVVTTFSHEIDIDQCTKTSTSISHHINIIKRKIYLKQLFTKKISGQKILPCPDTRAGQGRAGQGKKPKLRPALVQGRAGHRAGQGEVFCPADVSAQNQIFRSSHYDGYYFVRRISANHVATFHLSSKQ